MSAKVSWKKSLRLTHDKSLKCVYLQLQIDPWEEILWSNRQDYLDSSVRSAPENYTQAFQHGWNQTFGSTRTQEMSPGNRAADKAIARARIKKRNRCPKRKFKPGDIVIPHQDRNDLAFIGEGIVLFKPTPSGLGSEYVNLFVFWAAKDINLYTEARKHASMRIVLL